MSDKSMPKPFKGHPPETHAPPTPPKDSFPLPGDPPIPFPVPQPFPASPPPRSKDHNLPPALPDKPKSPPLPPQPPVAQPVRPKPLPVVSSPTAAGPVSAGSPLKSPPLSASAPPEKQGEKPLVEAGQQTKGKSHFRSASGSSIPTNLLGLTSVLRKSSLKRQTTDTMGAGPAGSAPATEDKDKDKDRERVRDKVKGWFTSDKLDKSGSGDSDPVPASGASDGQLAPAPPVQKASGSDHSDKTVRRDTPPPSKSTDGPAPPKQTPSQPTQPGKPVASSRTPPPPPGHPIMDLKIPKPPSSGSTQSTTVPRSPSTTIVTPHNSKEPLVAIKQQDHHGSSHTRHTLGPVPSEPSYQSEMDEWGFPEQPLQPPVRPSQALTQQQHGSGSQSRMLAFQSEAFKDAVTSADKTVERLQTTMTVCRGMAGALELGAGWLPGVGKGVELIVEMLDQAKELSLGKVAALRLVERAATVLNAVQQAVIDNKGRLSPVMEKNINTLITNIEGMAGFMTKLSQRPFLKLYLHMDDTQRQIDRATEDLQDFIEMFKLQSIISTAAWQQQSQLDHQHDLELLVQKQDAARKDDRKLLEMLEIKADQQQEAIKTLQRTLDRFVAAQSGMIETRTEYSEIDVEAMASKMYHEAPAKLGESESVSQVGGSTPATTQGQTQPFGRPAGIPLQAKLKVESPKASTFSHDIAQVPSPRGSRKESFDDTHSERHRQFCERALDVLRRHSTGAEAVPDWTITELEVDLDQRVNSGYFSQIWRGKWQGKDVAIKKLNPTTDRELFIHEVDVWRQLRSPYILPFLGASSTTGPPPWFLVSPYMRHGDVLTYLHSESGSTANRLTLLYQIAKGMEYLHGREIIHGDFKASNVLVDEDEHAIIGDFGLSKLKFDMIRRSEPNNPIRSNMGTMRWQSPERLRGGPLSYKDDVYAFGITICELYTEAVPYGYVDDFTLRQSILNGTRPKQPQGIPASLWKLCQKCLAMNPVDRPPFVELVRALIKLCPSAEVERRTTIRTMTTDSSSYTTADEGDVWETQTAISPEHHDMALPDEDLPSSSSSESLPSLAVDAAAARAPSSFGQHAERLYRYYLTHEFDDRLTLPLWTPSVVNLGEVGYIRNGKFVKLLDAHHPPAATKDRDLPPMPYLDEFSSLHTHGEAVNVRNAAAKGLDLVSWWANFIRTSGEQTRQAISRRFPFPLRPGMKQAALIVDDGLFEIYDSFAEARAYLVANIGWIMKEYGESHRIHKEEVIIVVGTLKASNFAMLISNFTPRTTITFNVHAKLEAGSPWGTWSVNRKIPDMTKAFQASNSKATSKLPKMAESTGWYLDEYEAGGKGNYGPQADMALQNSELKYSVKVSTVTPGVKETVMLAKLRFPSAGSNEPALYP